MLKGLVRINCLLSLCLALCISCAKKEGCTDATANNYDIVAEIDDETCTFPSLTDNIIGKWTLTQHIVESKDSASINLISTDVTKSGLATYNADMTGTFNLDSTSSFTWIVSNDNVSITIDSVLFTYQVLSNTPTKQEWIRDSISSNGNVKYKQNIDITLHK